MYLRRVWQRPYLDLGPPGNTPSMQAVSSVWNDLPHWAEVRFQPVTLQTHRVRKMCEQRTGRCGERDYSKSFMVHGEDNHRVMVALNSISSRNCPDAVKVLWMQDQVCVVAAAHLRSSSLQCSSPGLLSGIQSILFRRETPLYVNPKTHVLTQTIAYFDECRVSNVI